MLCKIAPCQQYIVGTALRKATGTRYTGRLAYRIEQCSKITNEYTPTHNGGSITTINLYYNCYYIREYYLKDTYYKMEFRSNSDCFVSFPSNVFTLMRFYWFRIVNCKWIFKNKNVDKQHLTLQLNGIIFNPGHLRNLSENERKTHSMNLTVPKNGKKKRWWCNPDINHHARHVTRRLCKIPPIGHSACPPLLAHCSTFTQGQCSP